MDCGSTQVVEQIKKLVETGEIRAIEGLWVTHYHDDHVDAIPAFQKAFDCPCITDEHVAQVITDPMRWRLPCISPSKARVDRPTQDGESWQWHEFRLTAYHFPGQTLYHAGLLVEAEGLRMLFAGDSFTMGGIDDYCAHNRNWLGRGVGFDRCLALIEQLQADAHLQLPCQRRLRFHARADRASCERIWPSASELFGELVPWDHANYGMDEPWVRCHPYEQTVSPGGKVDLSVVMTNHSTEPRPAACRAVLPAAIGAAATAWVSIEVPGKADGQLQLSFSVPSGVPTGRHVVAIDVCYGKWVLPQFTEAIVVV